MARPPAPVAAALAGVLAAGLLAACGGSSDDPPVASDTPTPSATTRKPRPKPSKPATPTPTPTPTATTPPPVTGDPVGTAEALVHLVSGDPRPGNDCAALVPDMVRPVCTALKTDGGNLLSVTGRLDGRKAVRLLVQTPDGYLPRYEGRDDGRSWASLKAYAAPLTGHGTDGVVFVVRLTDGALTYDVLTWVRGGPLVLRAHRTPLADGRLAPKDGALDEYELAVDGSFVRRRLAWDGRRFLLSKGVRTTTAPSR